MSQRGEWTFVLEASELRELAEKKVAHHKGRAAHYESEQQRLQDVYVESVREAAEKAAESEATAAREWLDQLDGHDAHTSGKALAYATTTPGVRQAINVIGDQDTYQQLQRAQQKIQEHVTKVATYNMWVTLLGRAKEGGKLDLDIEDAHFFGLDG